MPRTLPYSILDAKWAPDEDELIDIFGEVAVTHREGSRYTVKDPDYPGSFDIDLDEGTCSKNIVVFEDAGIFYKGIAEFYILSSDAAKDEFKLGNVEVTIESGSSLLYLLVGRDSEDVGLGYELREADVVKLKNVTEENALGYLDKAVFKMGLSQDMSYVWPTVGVEQRSAESFSEYLPQLLDNIGDKDFQHESPINCFNTAMRAENKHEEFLQLYKILEFYWQIAIDEKIVDLRRSPMGDAEFIHALEKIRTAKEQDCLEQLLSAVLDEDVTDFIKDEAGVEFANSKDLAKQIYEFRNSIVHAKEEKIEKATPAERYVGEFSNQSLVDAVEYLSLNCIERWGLK